MPIFIDEIVFRGEVLPAGVGGGSDRQGGGAVVANAADRQAMIADVTEAVIEHLERALERVGER
jgi:hypothetical protein